MENELDSVQRSLEERSATPFILSIIGIFIGGIVVEIIALVLANGIQKEAMEFNLPVPEKAKTARIIAIVLIVVNIVLLIVVFLAFLLPALQMMNHQEVFNY